MKIYEAQKTAGGYTLEVPAGLNVFTGMNFLTLKIRTPSGILIFKSLDKTNLIPEKSMVKFQLLNTDTSETGIFDYQLVNVTGGINQIGTVKQFYIRANIF